MTKPMARDPIYRKRAFDADIIELCVRWYITYRLSYRDLVEMMAERGVQVAHSTILRWVMRYVPEFEKRWNRFSRFVGTSWRVDETYISIKAKWHYLYRAVDKHGKTVDFLLRRDRGIHAAQAFFRKALASNAPRVPRKVTLDGHVPTRRALWLLRREHPCWRNLKVRTCKYLNNIVEQDHRAIKRRCASMAGCKSFANAAITIAGIELAHRIRKGQFSFGRGRRRHDWSRKAEGGRRNGQWHSHRNKFGAQRASSRSKYPVLHQNQQEWTVFAVFDCVFHDGMDLRRTPLYTVGYPPQPKGSLK